MAHSASRSFSCNICVNSSSLVPPAPGWGAPARPPAHPPLRCRQFWGRVAVSLAAAAGDSCTCRGTEHHYTVLLQSRPCAASMPRTSGSLAGQCTAYCRCSASAASRPRSSSPAALAAAAAATPPPPPRRDPATDSCAAQAHTPHRARVLPPFVISSTPAGGGQRSGAKRSIAAGGLHSISHPPPTSQTHNTSPYLPTPPLPFPPRTPTPPTHTHTAPE